MEGTSQGRVTLRKQIATSQRRLPRSSTHLCTPHLVRTLLKQLIKQNLFSRLKQLFQTHFPNILVMKTEGATRLPRITLFLRILLLRLQRDLLSTLEICAINPPLFYQLSRSHWRSWNMSTLSALAEGATKLWRSFNFNRTPLQTKWTSWSPKPSQNPTCLISRRPRYGH